MRRVVLIESPFSGLGTEAIRYLACCILDSVIRGEAPIASHALYPLALPEHVAGDGFDWPRTEFGRRKTGRSLGKECHGALMSLHEVVASGNVEPILHVAYTDLGESSGMKWDECEEIERRRLEGTAREIWERGEWPTNARWESTNEQ